MFRNVMIGSLASLALAFSAAALAQGQYGTAAEAKAMLEKAVAAVKADKVKALDIFNKGEGGFKDRDLYPFCFNISDGILTAGPAKGKDVRTLKDPSGRTFGMDVYKAAEAEEKINEVSYMFPRPGETTPSPKVSFVTRVGDQGCGVGYYKT
jgi:hypothetical protein